MFTKHEVVIEDYEVVRPRLMMALINRTQNEELITQVPHVSFKNASYSDMEIVFYIFYPASMGLSYDKTIVTNEMTKSWGIPTDVLYDDARQNLCGGMSSVMEYSMSFAPSQSLRECVQADKRSVELFMRQHPNAPIYLTFDTSGFGAVTVTNYDMMCNFASILGSFYIVPLSICTCMLVPLRLDGFVADVRFLQAFFKRRNAENTNETMVSEHLMFFSADSLKSTIIY